MILSQKPAQSMEKRLSSKETVYVVDEDAKTAYQAQAPWSEYEIVVMPTGIEEVETDKTAPTIVGCYDLNGKLINGKQRGAVIVRYSDGTTRKVLKWPREKCRWSDCAKGAEVTARKNSPSHRPVQLSCSEILSDIQWFIRSSKGVFYKLRAFERSLSRNL